MSSSHLILTLSSVSSTERKRKYTQLNAEFQRIARGDKKAFFSKQCKELKENNRREETRYLSRETGNIKGIFHRRMGTIRTEAVES